MRQCLYIMSVCSFLMFIASTGFVAANTFAGEIVQNDPSFVQTPLAFLLVFCVCYVAYIVTGENNK